MIKLFGNTLVFSDLHVGVRGDSPSRLNLSIKAVDEILKLADTNAITNIIFLGDWFNSREYIHTVTLTIGYQLMALLAADHNVIVIAGNHDIESNVYSTISPLYTFGNIPNVSVFHTLTEFVLNDKLCLAVPWGYADVDNDTAYDFIFGHLNVSGSAVRYNRVTGDISDNANYVTTTINDVRTFAKHLKPNGTCFSGHIHIRTEHIYRSSKIVFVGSPFELTFGETSAAHGLYIIENNEAKFHEIPNMPKHITLKISDCIEDGKLKDISYFSKFNNAIIKKIIDIDLTSEQQTELNTILSSLDMYDFVESELCYNLIDTVGENGTSHDMAKLTLHSYIDIVFETMTDVIFETAGTTKDKLKRVFSEYTSEYNN